MKSRITIEVDFNNGNQPIIQIMQRSSDDVRDNLLQSFLQSLHGSSWLNIKWVDYYEEGNERTARIHINPVKPEQLLEQSKIMAKQASLEKKFYEVKK